jgi:hypothetical protein
MTTDTVTIRTVAKTLDITSMAVSHWTHGSRQRKALPAQQTQCGLVTRITIKKTDLEKWLAQYRPDLLRVWQQAERRTKRRSSRIEKEPL